MGLKKSTIVVVSENTDRTRQFRIPRFLFIALPLFLCFLAVAGWFFTENYLRMRSLMPRLDLLEDELDVKRSQVAELAWRIDSISDKMVDLNDLDRRLRVMVNLSDGYEQENFPGIGGSPSASGWIGSALSRKDGDAAASLHDRLDALDDQADLMKRRKSELYEFLEQQKEMLASTPSIRPTKGWLSSRFGYRTSPFTGKKEFHRGIDIATRRGAPILSPADGKVSSVYSNRSYGKVVVISHGFGLETIYAHLDKVLVNKGQQVTRGDGIGLVGSSGRSTGNHLHYEVKLEGVNVDPLHYILD